MKILIFRIEMDEFLPQGCWIMIWQCNVLYIHVYVCHHVFMQSGPVSLEIRERFGVRVSGWNLSEQFVLEACWRVGIFLPGSCSGVRGRD